MARADSVTPPFEAPNTEQSVTCATPPKNRNARSQLATQCLGMQPSERQTNVASPKAICATNAQKGTPPASMRAHHVNMHSPGRHSGSDDIRKDRRHAASPWQNVLNA